MKLARASLVALALSTVGALALADSRELSEPLRRAGFVSSLDDALARARSERKLVLLYLAPSWFESSACAAVERDVLSSTAFVGSSRGLVPVRLVVDQESELLRRTWSQGFPTLRILGPDGFVVAAPRENTVAGITSAVIEGLQFDAGFKAKVRSADLSKPAVRAELVAAHVNRGDFASAIKLYEGFDTKSASPTQRDALLNLADALQVSRRFDELEQILDRTDANAPAASELKKLIVEIRVKSLEIEIGFARARNDDKAALELIATLERRFPSHPAAKDAEALRRRIQK